MMDITISQLKVFKGFKSIESELKVTDVAEITIKKEVILNSKNKEVVNFLGKVKHRYINGFVYETNFSGKTLKKVIKSCLTEFELRKALMVKNNITL